MLAPITYSRIGAVVPEVRQCSVVNKTSGYILLFRDVSSDSCSHRGSGSLNGTSRGSGTCVPLAAFVIVAVALHVEVDVRARSEASHAYKANDLASAH